MPDESLPVIGDTIGVLALVPDDWSDPWQRRHQVLSRLAARFPVAWIAPARRWRAPRRGSWSQDNMENAAPPPADGMFIMDSRRGVPTVNRPRWLSQATYRRRVRRGYQWLRHVGCTAIELQVWRPEYAGALDWVPFRTSSYHVDDEYSWSEQEQPPLPQERTLLTRAGRVHVTSSGLLASKGAFNSSTHLSPNGVDYRRFATPAPAPSDLASISRPRVGYVGVLKEQLDWGLLRTLPARLPDCSFVFVGPVREGHDGVHERIRELSRNRNVHVLGARDPRSLPAYVQGLDVALLPYRRNSYTDCIDPLKLYEALAAGTPVVSARLRTVEAFASVVRLADGVDDWTAAIGAAVAGDARQASRKAERQAAVRSRDWDSIVGALAADIVTASAVPVA